MPKVSGPVVVGATALATYRDCHEKYRNRYVQLYVPKKLESKRSFGSAFHAACESYYNDQDIELAEAAFVHIAREADMPLTMDTDEPRSIERGISLLHAWVKKWENEPFRIMRDKDGKPFTELRFSLHLFDYNGFPVMYSGTIDKIVQAGGRIYIPDIKTTTRSLSTFQNSMRPNHALTGYYVGAREFLGDEVFAVGYDAIFISKRKPNPKKGGWWSYGIDMDKDFMRTFSTRSQTDVDLWWALTKRDTLDLIRDMERDESGPWSMNAPTACWRYGRCDYMDSCIHNQDPIVIESLYDKVEWQPHTDTKDETKEESDNGIG